MGERPPEDGRSASSPRPRAGDSTPGTAAPDPARGLTTPHAASLPGLPAELIDHPTYEVQRELGRGGMGVVYLARNKIMDRPEVLKVLQDRLAGRPDLLQRFVNEVRLAARVQHPNIATAYQALPLGNTLVLAMEYVDGYSLADVVKRKGPLPVAHACYYARQVALGLQRAHEHGLVHRDIKPQNLMVTRRGEVKILDFGLAKVTSEQGDSGLTGDNAMMGTPDYMPPEQATDARNADIRADIYSLGCTLYHLLAGKPPFSGRSSFEVMQAHQSQPPSPLTGPRPEAPAQLADLVDRMLAKRPEDRPQAPMEVARALLPFCKAADKAEKGEDKAASVPPLPKSATAVPQGRSVPPLPLPAQSSPPAVRTELPPSRPPAPRPDPAPRAEPPPAGRRAGLFVAAALALAAVAGGVGLWASGLLTPPEDGPGEGPAPQASGRATEARSEGGPKAPIYNAELLTNPGCEDTPRGLNLPGWTVVTGNWGRRSRGPLPQEGAFYFFAGRGPLAELQQIVSVSQYSAAIDAERQRVAFRGYVRSYPAAKKKKADACRIVVECLGADAAQALVTYDMGSHISVNTWRLIEGTRTVPKGTRFVRVRLISLRRSGNNNDGYFDGLSLRALPPEGK